MAKKKKRKSGQMLERVVPKKRKKRKKQRPRHPSGLTPKQMSFVDAYSERMGNASQAARDVGYAFPVVTGCQLLSIPKIKAEIERRREILRQRSDDRYFAERAYLRRRATTVITDVADIGAESLTMKDLTKLPRSTVAAIKQISITRTKWGTSMKVALHDARADLELVWKTEGRLLPDNATPDDEAKFRDMIEGMVNGGADAEMGVPANAD